MFGAEHLRLSELSPAGYTRPELVMLLAELHALESHVTERRLACLASIDLLNDAGPDAVTVGRNITRRSTRDAKKTAAVASALASLPATANALTRGEISIEHLPAVVDAAKRVSPDAADGLVNNAAAMPADLFAKTAREWAARHEIVETIETRHAKQRAERQTQWWIAADGMTHLHSVLDAITGQQIITALEQRVDQLWREDGGRDGSANSSRAPAQRRSPALVQLLTANTDSGNNRAKPHPKHMVIMHHHLKNGTTQFNNGTAVPQSVLTEIGPNAEVVGIVFGTNGQPLHLGQSVRLASRAQWIALIARDRGCTRCGAEPSRGNAHHIQQHCHGGPTNTNTPTDPKTPRRLGR